MEITDQLDFTNSCDSSQVCIEDTLANQWRPSAVSDYMWSFITAVVIISVFVIQQPDKLMHWMLLPLTLCGTLVGADAIRWFKGTYTVFDPKGVIGLYSINYFLIAPFLIVMNDIEGVETYVVSQWKPLLGIMAAFNCVGLVLYKIFQRIAFRRPSKVEWTYWTLNPSRATFFVPVFVVVAFLSFCIYLIRGGGLGSIILQEKQGEALLGVQGFGAIMILRDALPLTTVIGITAFRSQIFRARNSKTWLLVSICVFLLFFFTSGLRGSRAATAYGLICAGAMIHFFWRKLTVKIILLTLIPLGMFFYLYGFYKSAGIVGIRQLIQGQTTIANLQEQTKRTFTSYLIGDLSRAHVQAVEVDVLLNKPWPYRYRYGRTYPLAIGYLIPRQIWRSKPRDMGRIIAGTEMLYGEGTYALGGKGSRSSQLYGLAGEAMLNFGLFGIFPAFAVWGYIVGRLRRRLYSYKAGDFRLLMSGFWMLISFIILASDADQLVWFFTSLYIIPATLIYLISDKYDMRMSYE